MSELQDKLDAMRRGGVPLPLLPGQATAQALRLRQRGLTYGQIARCMEIYHGAFAKPDTWRRRCRVAGAEPAVFPFRGRAS